MVGNMMNFDLVFGGTDFRVPQSLLSSWALTPNSAISAIPLPPTPADFTLVRELFSAPVYVVYGGAKFWIPDPPTLFSLGFDWSQVRVLPPGGTNKIVDWPPIDGTLLREQHDAKVYLVESGVLSWVTSPAVMDARCLRWRHVRIVPDKALDGVARGMDII
jgi:hypothetical protein